MRSRTRSSKPRAKKKSRRASRRATSYKLKGKGRKSRSGRSAPVVVRPVRRGRFVRRDQPDQVEVHPHRIPASVDTDHLCKLASIAVGAVRSPEYSFEGLHGSEAQDAKNMFSILGEAYVRLLERHGQKPRFRVPLVTEVV